LLVSATFHPLVALIFPAWVVLVSIVVLTGPARSAPQAAGEAAVAGSSAGA